MQTLLGKLSELNVKLEIRDGKLHVNAPAGALTPDLQREIRERKEALIEALQSAQTAAPEALPQIIPDPAKRFEPFPLNDVQHAYWIGRSAQLELGSVSTHIYFELECPALEPARLSEAFQKVIGEHDMLRAVVDANGQQRVLRTVPAYEIAVSDLRGTDAERAEAELLRTRAELSRQVLPCDQWPLFDVRLAQISNEHSRLFVSWDFLMVDAWSLMLIFRQWFDLYHDVRQDARLVVLSFRDYVLAEVRLKEQATYQVSRKYWWDRLEQLPPAPQLPTETILEKQRPREFRRRAMRLPAVEWEALKSRARQLGITPTSALLGAFSEVLCLWSKSPHFCLNLTLFNRLALHPDVPAIVGDFTSLLALEIDAREPGPFADLCTRIQSQFLRDYDHRQVNALEVLRELGKRRGGQQALLPVVFTSTLMLDGKRNDDAGVLEQFGRMGYGVSQTPQVWLDYQIFDIEGELAINWDAVEEVFPPGVLDDMFGSHAALLRLLARDAEAWQKQGLAALPIPQQEQRELVNRTEAEIVKRRLHELFVDRALENPERVALVSSSGTMRYGELLAHANAIAEQLLQSGAKRTELVAVVMQKGWEQVAAVMGILIAGSAYLPVDPRWPTLRRGHILEHAEVRIALTQPALNRELEWPSHIHRIEIKRQEGLDLLTTAPALRQSVEDLAYVIFTSGSTGNPKGVMISHCAAINTVAHMNRLFGVGAEDSVLAVSDLTFDLSVYDIFGILGAGGTVVIPDAALSRDYNHWEDLTRRHHVTVWNSAPPLMGMLADGWEFGSLCPLASLRIALLSGDWIPVSLPDRVRRMSPEARIISLGGATEGSIWSIYYPIEQVSREWVSIPYGKALPNQRMYVLDQRLQPRPDLVTGDIYIGGLGVASGYLNDPANTARQFLTHPRTGERLYYTGDLGRMCRDGNIEFLGRADSQVKLRGYRVELREIAACLQTHPGVRDAAVQILKQDNRTVLAAYVVVNGTGSGLIEQGRRAADALPDLGGEIRAAGAKYSGDAERGELQRFWEFWKSVERSSVAAMIETLGQLGLVDGSDPIARIDQLIQGGSVLPRYRRLLFRWLAALEAWGHVIARDGHYIVPAKDIWGTVSVADQVANIERTFGSDLGTEGFAEHAVGCLRNHLALLRGEMNPTSLLFPEGSWRVAESLYEKNPVVRHHNGLLAEVVRTVAESLDSSKRLRVLEIGAGTGGTSARILPALPASRTEYVYSDVSAFFFSAAREKFHSYPFIEYSIYDLNKNANEQGQQPHSYDLIIAANALHNAHDLDAVLKNTRELLRPGGYLLLLEGTRATPWMWATVAFLEALNAYTDKRAESGEWILETREWSQALASAGFEDAMIYPDEGSRPSDGRLHEFLGAMPQHVIAARAPASAVVFRPEALTAFVRERLPEHMVPQHFVLLEKIPVTANGKADWSALPANFASRDFAARPVVSPTSVIEGQILSIWKGVLGLEQVGVTDNFFEVGGDSLLITEVMRRLNRSRGTPLTIVELLSYPTIRSLADYLNPASNTQEIQRAAASQAALPQTAPGTHDIAIIGISGRFPDARNIEQFWNNIAAGDCAVRNFSAEELLSAGVSEEELADPNYVRRGLVLDNIDLFDAPFFGLTPRDAEIMDPQQRFLLECAVETLDDAGYPSEKQAGKIGVFAGKGTSFYLLEHLLPNAAIVRQLSLMPILNVNEKDYAATLISYKLNLTGPSVNVNTACSTSLVAVHLACESLLNGGCDLALAGGVSFVNLRKSGYLHYEGHIVSPDGICRAFSDDANGTIFGSGVGLVALKPLAAALRDRDTIHAVIKGSAINNDGSLKLSFNAPSVQGQEEVIAKAQARAGISADTIDLVEAHGTGTKLGDPIEFAALRSVFGGRRANGSRCALGSVKTNIGHLDTAAGIAGLIKAVQALKHRQIPPTLHVSAPTRKVDFEDSPFKLPETLKEWPAGASPRRACVSSFGVGGTNAHIILEEAPSVPERGRAAIDQILPVSAKTSRSLHEMMLAASHAFERQPELSLEDAAFTLQAGRNAYAHRAYAICDRAAEAREQFAHPERLPAAHFNETISPAVVFLFPGQGALQKDATSELYEHEPRFRSALDECADILREYTGDDFRDWLFTRRRADANEKDLPFNQTALMQPLLFSVEYALARFWESFGVRPAAMLGHSLGEYVAACMAGVFSLPEALSLVTVRGQLVQSLEPGLMIAVSCGEAQLAKLVEGSGCSVAAVNSQSQCVAAGANAAIEALQARIKAAGISSRRLRASHAFHSQMLDPILEIFEKCVAELELHRPSTPFVSNVSGTWITEAEAISPAYWATHLRATVRFGAGLQELLRLKNPMFLEVGPGRILTTLVRQTNRAAPAISSLNGERSQPERRSFLDAIGQLWVHGVEVDWTPLHEGREPGRISLPGYAFDRKRYWIERESRLGSMGSQTVAQMGAPEFQVEIRAVGVPAGVRDAGHEGAGSPIERRGQQSEIEARLVEIWKSYLGVENIEVRQSFFEMGGDSLLAARLHSQIRHDFDIDIPLMMMLELETIRNVALYIAISRDSALIDSLSEEDVDGVLPVMELWSSQGTHGATERASTN